VAEEKSGQVINTFRNFLFLTNNYPVYVNFCFDRFLLPLLDVHFRAGCDATLARDAKAVWATTWHSVYVYSQRRGHRPNMPSRYRFLGQFLDDVEASTSFVCFVLSFVSGFDAPSFVHLIFARFYPSCCIVSSRIEPGGSSPDSHF
jgi:hypothetical protein